MAIAVVEPLDQVKAKFSHPAYEGSLIFNDFAADEYYDRAKIREILIKFAYSENAMRRDMPAEQIVNEFMKSDDHA